MRTADRRSAALLEQGTRNGEGSDAVRGVHGGSAARLAAGADAEARAFLITAFPKGPDWPPKRIRRTPTTPVAGRPAWYSEEVPGDIQLIVDGGSCWMVLDNVAPVTAGQLRSLAAGTTVGDCDDQSTWTAPVR